MKCNRLITLLKNWYVQVQDESMAPARMIDFMAKHMAGCEECLADPDIKEEAEKIKEHILPPPKVPKSKEPVPDEDSVEPVEAETAEIDEDEVSEENGVADSDDEIDDELEEEIDIDVI